MSTIVTTQEELDAAIESGAEGIVIDSPPNVWLELRGSSRVVTQGSSHVVAWELSYAREWSAVRAWGDSHVNATPWVTVHRHSTTTTVTGGIIIDITSLDLSDPAVIQEFAATVKDGVERGTHMLLVKDACGSGSDAMHQTAVLNMANRLYGGAVADTARAIALIGGDTARVWRTELPVPIKFTWASAAADYAAL